MISEVSAHGPLALLLWAYGEVEHHGACGRETGWRRKRGRVGSRVDGEVVWLEEAR